MQDALRHDQVIRSVLERNITFSMYPDKITNISNTLDTETTSLNNTQPPLKLEKTQLLNENLLRQWSIHADYYELFDEPLMTWEQVEPELDRVLGRTEDEENSYATRIPPATIEDEPGLDDSGISAVLKTIYSFKEENQNKKQNGTETEETFLQEQDDTTKNESTITRSVLNEVKNVHSDKNSVETGSEKNRKHRASKSRATGKRTKSERPKRKTNAYKRKKRVNE
ncbi:hypothetical protein MP638_004603 [Amoeboaphelidium occidentale]|nr:hypothetical protein MP638_004603 [Amoeboaphelidium occidentale]